MGSNLQKILDQLDRVLRARDAIFPNRDISLDKSAEKLQADFVHEINRVADQSRFGFSSKFSLTDAEQFISNSVFVCGFMKSGTTLLIELLDGHPDLEVFPGDSWFMGRMKGSHKEAWPPHFNNWLTKLINPMGQEPFWLFGKTTASYSTFINACRYWSTVFEKSEIGHLKSLVLAHSDANPVGPKNPKLWVEKTPGNEFEIDQILKYFPKTIFIHIIRDPRENMSSLKKLYKVRDWDWDAFGTAKKLGESCRLAEENRRRLGDDRYCVLKYEELTRETEKCMRIIAEFLRISWNTCLLQPTLNGMKAHSNTMFSDRRVEGEVRPASMDKWKTVLSQSEQRMALHTSRDAKKVGYDFNISLGNESLYWLERLMNRLKK